MGNKSFCIYGVSAIIQKKIGQNMYILIQERYKGEESPESGLIEVPCGKVLPKESAFDVIRKKVYLETGLTVYKIYGENEANIFSCNLYKTVSFTPFHVAQNLENNYPITIDCFICEATGNNFQNSKDARNIRWISTNDLFHMLNTYPEKFYPMVYDALMKFCMYVS